MDAADDALIGRTLKGGYLVVEAIASGGMGRIYRAEQTTLGRSVAVKVINPWLVSDDMSVSRFVTEACAASRLQHPNSVAIHDFGETEDHLLYLVMELLRGEDLAHLVARTGPLPIPRIVDILEQALGALDEAHALHIVHRDIKPENFVIEKTRWGRHRVKLVDFGIAKIRSALVGRRSTMPGVICGTPEYMSPEQARGEPLDGRSDLYSVGVVLYELLTGRLPFDAEDRASIATAHIQDVPTDPRKVAPERCIPDALADLVLRTLAKRPEDRPTTARELSEALAGAIASHGHSYLRRSAKFCTGCLKRRHPVAVSPQASRAAADTTIKAPAHKPASRSRVMLLAVGLAGALASAPLASVVLHADPSVPTRAPSAAAAVSVAALEAMPRPEAAVASVAVESRPAPPLVASSSASAVQRSRQPTRPAPAVVHAPAAATASCAAPLPPPPFDKSEVL